MAVLVAALTGLVLVSLAAAESSTGPAPLTGVLLAIASGTTYALTTVAGGVDQPDDLATGAHERDDLVGAAVLLPCLAFVDGPRVTTDPVALAWLVYLGALTMALAYVLLYSGLRVVAPSTAVTAGLIEPVTARWLRRSCSTSRSARWRSSGSCWCSARWLGWGGRLPPLGRCCRTRSSRGT